MNTEMNTTIEIVEFRLARGTGADFVAANRPVNDWLAAQPGFVSRQLAERDDGSYIDILVWSDRSAAEAAAGAVMAVFGEADAMTMIDPESVRMAHAPLLMSRVR
jgi:hypothetical protein